MTQYSLFGQTADWAGFWEATPDAAHARLKSFVPRAGRAYATERNYDHGPENRSNISCLSPWIRHQLIGEEDVLRETLQRHSPPNAEKFVQEVFWRGYFKGWMEHHPSVWNAYRDDVIRLVGELNEESKLLDCYTAATSGRTGIDAFDFWVDELVTTGYLHNHARMWFASIWVFTLRLPWQLGADFFYRHLLDGDPASNTLSWRWVAGLHTRGKTYLARTSNIEKYTAGRFAPQNLAASAPALLESDVHLTQAISSPGKAEISNRFGLLVTEEHCNPSKAVQHLEYPLALCGLFARDDRSRLETSAMANAFALEALENAVSRAATQFGCASRVLITTEWEKALTGWAEENRLDTILTAYPPVGPTRDRLENARPALMASGIRLIYLPRRYDLACWPHTTKGFFKLKARIPEILQSLAIN